MIFLFDDHLPVFNIANVYVTPNVITRKHIIIGQYSAKLKFIDNFIVYFVK